MKMKNLLKGVLIGALYVFTHINVYGQNSSSELRSQGEPLNLSLDQAITIALSDNPTIVVANMEIEKANYAKKEVIGSLFPNINLAGSYTRNIEKQTMNMGGQTIAIGTDNSWAAGFSAGMPLINVQLWRSIKLTGEAVNQKVEEARASQIDMVSSVIEAYYAILNAQDSYEVLEKSYNTANENFRISKTRYEQGMASEYDAIQAEVQVKNLYPTLVSVKNGIDLAKLQLKVLMGLPADFPITIENKLADYEQEMFESVTLDDMDASLSDNPDIRQLEIATKLLERQLKLQKAQWYPTLSLAFVYQWTSQNDDFKFADYAWNPYSTVGLTLSFPIFQGGSRYYKQKQAKIAYDEMEYMMENTRRLLGMQLQANMDKLRVAIEQIGSTKEAAALAQKGVNISQKRYEVGAGSSLELISSENAYTQAQLSYYQAIYDYIVAKNALNKVLGNAYNEYIK